MKRCFLILIPLIFFSSCYHAPFEDVLFRTTQDPFYDTPQADSLSLENTVFLNWKEDDAADEFCLMRSFDGPELNFNCIYKGKETSFKDTYMSEGDLYIYRLDKIRGSKYFEGKSYAFGYASNCRNDECEDNNTQEKSTFLEYDRICNLPCVSYNTENHIDLDEDWYYISIPPRRTAEIVIGQANLIGNAAKNAPTNLMIQIVGKASEPVTHQKAYQIQNTSNETKTFYFKIYPKTTGLFSSNKIFVIEYKVSLNQIINYTS